jgi:hypothetical protein
VQKIKLQPNAPDEEKRKKKEKKRKKEVPRRCSNSVTHGFRIHGGAETESCRILIESFLLIGMILLGLFDWVDFVCWVFLIGLILWG